jgi:tetratricopeptide (TPR) repeat protein
MTPKPTALLSACRAACGALLALYLGAGAPADTAGSLLDALKAAPTEQQSAALETKIVLIWRARVTPAVQLLLDHATDAMEQQDRKTAMADLDAALDLQPEQADLWRLHAEARFANGDDAGALADLAQALSREPRLFPALEDLSRFAESRNDYPRALEAWQRFLDLDPKAAHGTARLEVLQRKVAGQPL